MKKNNISKILSYVIISAIVVMMIVPIGYLIINSLTDTEMRYGEEQFRTVKFSLKQFAKLFIDSNDYFYIYTRTFVITCFITIMQLITSIICGFLFGMFRFKLKRPLIITYVLVMLLPYSATLLPNYIILRYLGLLNTHASIILPAIFYPLGTIIITIFLSNIPKETVEAALFETTSIYVILKHIVLPQIIQAIALTGIITFTETWSMVEQPQALIENKYIQPLSVSLNSIFSSGDIMNYAGGVLYLIPPIIVLFAFSNILFEELLIQVDSFEVSHAKDK